MDIVDNTPIPSISEIKPTGYRKRALEHYRKGLKEGCALTCIVCGFGIEAVLEVAHLNQDRKDGRIENLVVMCPTCHKMYDIGLIPEPAIKALQQRNLTPNWKLRIKDAGAKAAAKRKANAARKKNSEAGKKAWIARRKAVSNDDQSIGSLDVES